jgi:hypothetical protein
MFEIEIDRQARLKLLGDVDLARSSDTLSNAIRLPLIGLHM